MSFDLRTFAKAREERIREWEVTERTLYDLCRKHPNHDSANEVNAKLWIIGRTYATGVERTIKTDGKQGGSLAKPSRHLVRNREKMAKITGCLSEVREPLDRGKLRTIVKAHGHFVNLIRPILSFDRSLRAFASKYLHFHCPAVPVYDSWAVRALRKEYRWSDDFIIFQLPAKVDEEYAYFVMRFWQLYQEAQVVTKQARVKDLDNYLLWIADRMQ